MRRLRQVSTEAGCAVCVVRPPEPVARVHARVVIGVAGPSESVPGDDENEGEREQLQDDRPERADPRNSSPDRNGAALKKAIM